MQKVIPVKSTTFTPEHWLETMNDLAEILAEDYGDGLEVEVNENGDEFYTYSSQEKFNAYIDAAESIMVRLGFVCEEKA